MRKRKFLWRKALPPSAWEELEVWTSVLLVVAAGLLLYATLTAQAAAALEHFHTEATMPASAQRQAAFPKTVTPGSLLRWRGATALVVTASLTVATHLPTRTWMPELEQRREQPRRPS
jgi:hypothetical protein